MAQDRHSAVAALLLVGSASLFLISSIDDNCYWLLARVAPGWKIFPALRITSLLVCGLLCLWFARASMRAPQPATPWRLVVIATLPWLCGSALALFAFHVWTPFLPTWIDIVSFLGTGLLAEELLFRGAVFSLAETVFPPASGLPLAAIGISAVLFGAQHLGYHGWHLSTPALTQMGYTIIFGLLLGLLRVWSGTLWVPAAAHVANNLLTVLYRHFGN